MTVKELIEELKDMDPERLVVLQKDSEGNGFSPLSGADDNARYVAETTWHGEIKYERLSAEQRIQGYTDSDVTSQGVPACVLFPVN